LDKGIASMVREHADANSGARIALIGKINTNSRLVCSA
jgi:hypothetical protein